MTQSLSKLIVHIIFGTKHREPVIARELRTEVESYLGGILRNLKCPSIEIGCQPEHVHILCCLSKNLSLAGLLEDVKKSSSKWIKTKGSLLRGFSWQGGYAGTSVSQSNVEAVRCYIRNQDAHHRKLTFQEEFRAFLERHEIDFDERYVWE